MHRKILVSNLLIFGAANLAVGGPIRVGSIGSAYNNPTSGCTLMYCVESGLTGFILSDAKTVTKSFAGASQITTSLPSQFTAALRQGALAVVASAPAVSDTTAAVGGSSTGAPQRTEQGDTSTYVLSDGQVQQRGAYGTENGTGSQSVVSNLPAIFNLYSTGIVSNSSTADKQTGTPASSDGSLASVSADVSTGGSTSSGSDSPVVPTLGADGGSSVESSFGTSGGNVYGGSGSSTAATLLSDSMGMTDAPEPSTEVMLGIGLVAIGFATRVGRKRGQK